MKTKKGSKKYLAPGSFRKLRFQRSKNIGLVFRDQSDEAYNFSVKVSQWLIGQGFTTFCPPGQKMIPGCRVLKTSKDTANLSLFVVLGGDGTYLKAVRLSHDKQIPVMGINLGSLGFLTKHRVEFAFKLLEDTVKEKLVLRPRFMLHALVKRKGKLHADFFALNDVVIERGGTSHLINTALCCDEFQVAEMKADGVIICTPTGSTAYNLAAGGPIMHPESRAIGVTPIAPHNLTLRPLIFPEESRLQFKIQNKMHEARLSVDGQEVMKVGRDDEVYIEKSKNLHWMVQQPEYDYFGLLREKLKFGERA